MMWIINQLVGGLWPYVAAGAVAIVGVLGSYMARKREARQKAKQKAAEAKAKALADRERIENEIDQDDNLAARADRAGVVRRPGK